MKEINLVTDLNFHQMRILSYSQEKFHCIVLICLSTPSLSYSMEIAIPAIFYRESRNGERLKSALDLSTPGTSNSDLSVLLFVLSVQIC